MQEAQNGAHCGNFCGGPQELPVLACGVSEDRCRSGGGKGTILPWPSPRNDLSMSIHNAAVQTGKGTTQNQSPVKGQPDFNQVSESLVSADAPTRCKTF